MNLSCSLKKDEETGHVSLRNLHFHYSLHIGMVSAICQLTNGDFIFTTLDSKSICRLNQLDLSVVNCLVQLKVEPWHVCEVRENDVAVCVFNDREQRNKISIMSVDNEVMKIKTMLEFIADLCRGLTCAKGMIYVLWTKDIHVYSQNGSVVKTIALAFTISKACEFMSTSSGLIYLIDTDMFTVIKDDSMIDRKKINTIASSTRACEDGKGNVFVVEQLRDYCLYHAIVKVSAHESGDQLVPKWRQLKQFYNTALQKIAYDRYSEMLVIIFPTGLIWLMFKVLNKKYL